jgi:Do/DeqQ family serine protease
MLNRHNAILRYLLQAIILGLALAFLLVVIWPDLLRPTGAPVEVREAPADSVFVPRAAVGPVSYASAVEKAAPTVVNINTAKVVSVRQNPFFDDPMFRQFFGRELDNLITPRKRVETSLGSGVIMSEQGYLLTNHHVIRGADAIQVSLRDGRTAQAKVVGSDPDTDLAVLKIDLPKLPAITLGQSERLRIGDVVLAIGNPFGVGQTVTMGIVSATGRNKLGINVFENFIQTDAAINPGNSGGALVDAEGNLVGINTAIFSKSGGYQGIGFAIPAALARSVLDDIIRHGRPIRGWIGVDGNVITPELARALDLKTTQGVIIAGVVRNGPAHRAGVEPGDVIQTIDGVKITDAREALMAISARKPGSQVRLGLMREGKSLTIEVPVIERPARAAQTE